MSDSRWSGYINDKGQTDEKYGYIESLPHPTNGQLRLTCYPPLGFRVYLPEGLLLSAIPDNVTFKVDRLRAIELPVDQDGRHYFVSNQTEGFWDLIAQLIAGITLTTKLSETKEFTYSLRGFSRTYRNHCNWVTGADTYRQYIGRYR